MGKALKRSVAFTMALMLVFMSIATFVTDETFAVSKTHLKKSTVTITVGKSYTQKLLSASGKTISSSKVTWKSSDRNVATVSSKGVIKAKKVGKVTIKAIYNGKTYKCKCTVGNLAKQLPKVSKPFKNGTAHFSKSVRYLCDWKLDSSLKAATLAADYFETAMEKCGSYQELADLKSQLKGVTLQLRATINQAKKQSEIAAFGTLQSNFSNLVYKLEDIGYEMEEVLAEYLE